MLTFLILVLLGCVSYRIGRFLALDTLIEGTRDKVVWWLTTRNSLWADKLVSLLACPYCITIWTGFFATLYWSLVLADWPGWWFPVYWLAVSTVAVGIWTYIDSD